MNPLDKSWEFLKAPVDEKKFAFEQKQREDEAAAQKKKARDAKSAETKQTKLNLGPSMQESAPSPGEAAMNRITTTPSRASVEKPTEGTGFETLTEEQLRDLKYRRRGA